MIRKIEVNECECVCGHVWVTRTQRIPLVCPRCGNRKWNRDMLLSNDHGERDVVLDREVSLDGVG